MKSDSELMVDFSEGDDASFDMLVKRHQVGLLNFFHRLVWDRSLAEDLTQEVFLKLYTHRAGYEPRAKFTTYLYRIARNSWIDYLRRTKADRKSVSLDAEDRDGRSLGDVVSASAEDPRANVSRDELTEAVIEAIDGLAEDHKLVFILSEVQGMKYQEVADTLNIPVGTVKSRMFHAIKRLRERLARSMKGATGPWQDIETDDTED